MVSRMLLDEPASALDPGHKFHLLELLEKLVKKLDCPIILEGRIWEPSEVDKAFDIGAYSVVIGSAVTRPQLITKRFCIRG